MKNLTPMDRQQLIEDIQFKSASGEESLGKSIRRLRLEITGLDQDSFARMCKLTTKTLSTLENDRGNPTINTLNGILKPFGLAITLGALRHQPTTPIRQNEEEPARKRGASPKRQKAALQTSPFQPVAE
ncbi:helix-turn-helix transcriptional regulator [Pseudomonas sp. Q2-TVG4-2]|uniref:helix-turn-helix transcriptional regulator n=1 Tax=Pseudomonas sp. Q2-TVG4-2 TaxID=1685699 RepID=UPI0015E66DBF|nr:helix-turn-helix transcriptional regulator [Pseudomonas sp. Q2-TVG4-2]